MKSGNKRLARMAMGMLALAMIFPTSAQALTSESARLSGATLTSIPDGSVLATPEEVAVMGGSAKEVALQRKVWASLPTATSRQQRDLNAAEATLAEAAFANIVTPPNVTIQVSPQTCGGASYYTYYKISSDIQAEQCFAGAAGTYTLTTQFVNSGNTATIRLTPQAKKGRAYYSIQTTQYWTLTRGPNDNNWYTFPAVNYDVTLRVLKVQLY